MEIGEGWHQWKKTLGSAVNVGETVGMSEETINDISYRIGEFLTNNFDPANGEQRLLKELWEEGNDNEKHTLAKLVARMAHK